MGGFGGRGGDWGRESRGVNGRDKEGTGVERRGQQRVLLMKIKPSGTNILSPSLCFAQAQGIPAHYWVFQLTQSYPAEVLTPPLHRHWLSLWF